MVASCSKEQADPGSCNIDIEDARFGSDILPIITTNCAISNCHNTITVAAQIQLTDHSTISSFALQERFLGAIKQEGGFPFMPQGANKLPEEKIAQIECWILRGVPND